MQIVDKIFFDPITKGLKFFGKHGSGDVGTSKYRVKRLTAAITTTTNDVADFRITDLVAGRLYKVTNQIAVTVSGSAGNQYVYLDAVHNSVVRASCVFNHPYGNANGREATYCAVGIFRAENASLTFNVGVAGTSSLNFNSSHFGSSLIIIEELPQYVSF
jgi:hypothetical protein